MAIFKRTVAALALMLAPALARIPTGSTLITVASTPATCVSNGIALACGPTPTPSAASRHGPLPAPLAVGPFDPPFVDNSTVVCDSSAVVGTTIKTIGKLLNATCGAFETFEHNTTAPIVVTKTAPGGNEITFQMGWTFSDDHDGFGLPLDFCYYGFMYALETCTNAKRPLSLGGVAAATYLGYRLSFEVSVLDVKFGKRAEPLSERSQTSNVAELVSDIIPTRFTTTATSTVDYIPPVPTETYATYSQVTTTTTATHLPLETGPRPAAVEYEGTLYQCVGVNNAADKSLKPLGNIFSSKAGRADPDYALAKAWHTCIRKRRNDPSLDWTGWENPFALEVSGGAGATMDPNQCYADFVSLFSWLRIGDHIPSGTYTTRKAFTYSIDTQVKEIDLENLKPFDKLKVDKNASITKSNNTVSGCMPKEYLGTDAWTVDNFVRQVCLAMLNAIQQTNGSVRHHFNVSNYNAFLEFSRDSSNGTHLTSEQFRFFCQQAFAEFTVICPEALLEETYDWRYTVGDGVFHASFNSSRVKYDNVTCGTSGALVSLKDLQDVTDLFCTDLSSYVVPNNTIVPSIYEYPDQNATVSAYNECDGATMVLDDCKASFANVIADCTLDGISGRGGMVKSDDCMWYLVGFSR